MNTAEANRQAFEIWYGNNPQITIDDCRRAGIIEDIHSVAKKVFFSDAYEFTRWTIISGFKDFLDKQDKDRDTDFDGEYTQDQSDYDQTKEVLKNLWHWMRANEKELTTAPGNEDPNIHVLAHALINGLNIEAAEKDRKIGTHGYAEAKRRVYSLLYGGK